MKTQELMTKNPGFCLLNDTVYKAAWIMKSRNCGVVPVVKDRRSKTLQGVITDRDLALYLSRKNKPAKRVRLADFSFRRVKFVHPTDNIRRVARLMEKFHIHRIPVVDNARHLKGIISLKDLAKEAVKEKSRRNQAIKERDIAGIVERISCSR